MSDNKLDWQTQVKLADPSLYLPAASLLTKDRITLMEHPGAVRYWTEKGHRSGCACVCFGYQGKVQGLPENVAKTFKEYATQLFGTSDINPYELLNAFFMWQGNMELVDWQVDDGAIVAFFTNFMSEQEYDEQMEVIEEAHRLVAERKSKEKLEREEAEARVEKETREKQAQVNELIALGKKAKDHGWKEQIEKLEAEVKKLRREVRNAR